MFKSKTLTSVLLLLAGVSVFSCAGTRSVESGNQTAQPSVAASQTPRLPEPGDELLDERNSTSQSPIANFDFKNFTYEIPRGWQDADGEDVELVNGKRPLSEADRKIGFSYLTTKFMDVTGDGQDEALVVLRIETGGASIPQIVYVFTWNDGQPEMIWRFRTGDRADGGIKNFFVDNGEFVLELFGQDRYILGDVETARITGDEEDLCCPTSFTVSRYKYSGNTFRLTGKRLTYKVSDPLNHPQENLGDKANQPQRR